MAEQPQNGQSKGIGELFVEFGSTGLGELLKGLNGIKAQFLLSKAAAEQFTKPLINMSKNAAGGVTALTKLNAVTGMSIRQLQELQVWTKLNNVSFGEMMGQIEGLQNNLLEIAMGRGNVRGFALLGLDPRQMDYRKPLEAFTKIRERVQQLDEATGALALKELGFSQDLLYAFKQQNNAFDERLLLNEKETQSLTEQQAAWNRLSATWQVTQDKFIAQQKWIIDLLNGTRQAMEFMSGNKEQKKEIVQKYATKTLTNTLPWYLRNPIVEKIPALNAISKVGAAAILLKTNQNQQNSAPISQQKTAPSQNIAQPFQLETIPDSELGADNSINESLPAMPSVANAGGNTTSVQVAVTQNISGDNAVEIAARAKDGVEDVFNTLTIQNGVMV